MNQYIHLQLSMFSFWHQHHTVTALATIKYIVTY